MNLQELLTQLDTPIVIRPTRRMTQGELETYLDKAADILRGNADHSEFRGYVFALLFYKRISDCYDEEVRTQTATRWSRQACRRIRRCCWPATRRTTTSRARSGLG
jgi:type I restriction enzyme M protein